MLSYTLLMWREMVLHALTHLVKVGGGRWYSVLSYTLSKWVEGDGTPCSYTPCQSGWKEMVLHALIHLVNVEEELNSRFVAYLCLHLCIVVYNVYIYILYRCIQFVFVFVSLLENKRAQSFVLERRLGLVAIHSR